MKDCNNCVWLNMTEKQQQEDYGNKENHICMWYETRVLHNAKSVNHDAKIYPCNECNNDENRFYQKE